MSKELIRLANCTMAFDGEVVLDNINLYINDKEFLTLLGPSGCGKTTTLRIIGGFQEPTSGDVFFDGVRINSIPPHKRAVNTVFQRYALFPHLNVFENIAFGLRIPKVDPETKQKVKLPEQEIHDRVMEMLQVVNLKGFEKRRITQLSGGQQQRVAIARALVNRPKVLLLDEPLGALDLKLRKDMQNELKRIQQSLGITFIYVTHDQEEALAMSDTVVVMDGGKIQQIGTPEDIYNEPKNAFVADFIGESNILDGIMRAGGRGHPARGRGHRPGGPGPVEGHRHLGDLQGGPLRHHRGLLRLQVADSDHRLLPGGQPHRHQDRPRRHPRDEKEPVLRHVRRLFLLLRGV